MGRQSGGEGEQTDKNGTLISRLLWWRWWWGEDCYCIGCDLRACMEISPVSKFSRKYSLVTRLYVISGVPL